MNTVRFSATIYESMASSKSLLFRNIHYFLRSKSCLCSGF